MNQESVRKSNHKKRGIWHLYVEADYSLAEIAEIFKLSRTRVREILLEEAQRRNDQLQKHELKGKTIDIS